MISLSPDILTMTDEAAVLVKNGRLVYANKTAEDVLGSDWSEKTVRDIFGEEIANSQASSFAAALPVCGQQQIVRVSRISGGAAIFFTRVRPEIPLLNEAYLAAMRASLQNLSLALDAGRTRAEDLDDRPLRDCFTALTRNYFRLNRLLSNITAARGVLSHELPVTFGAVDLSGMCAAIADSVNILRPGVELRFHCSEEICLWGDAALLETLLLNLLSNCLVHADGLTAIELRLSATKERVLLALSDNGAGIPPEQLSSVFSRFRSGPTLRDMARGAGYGLTVVRGVAEAHGGTLLLESRPGIGTSVRVSLSRKLGAEGALREPAQPYVGNMVTLLTGLSDCLDEAFFCEKYFD